MRGRRRDARVTTRLGTEGLHLRTLRATRRGSSLAPAYAPARSLQRRVVGSSCLRRGDGGILQPWTWFSSPRNDLVAVVSRAATPSERRLAFLDLDVPRQGYNDEDKANALLVLETCGDDHAAAARATGIPYRTLYEWGRLGRVSQAALDIKAGKREVLADKLEALAHQLVDAAPKKIKRAGLAQTMVAAGVAVDKMRLLREQPTDIHRTENLTDEQRAERIAALIAVVCSRDDDGGNPLAFGDDAGEREGGNRPSALPAGDEGF